MIDTHLHTLSGVDDEPETAEIKERVNELQQVLNRLGILLRLFAGHEALLRHGLVEDIQAGRLAILNGSRYLLLELWNHSWHTEIERVVFELRALGITASPRVRTTCTDVRPLLYRACVGLYNLLGK